MYFSTKKYTFVVANDDTNPMTEIEILRQQLARKERIDKILIDISIQFAQVQNFDNAVETFLKYLIELTGYDRAHISMVRNGLMSFTHEVHQENCISLKPHVKNVPYEEMPWFKEMQIKNGYSYICHPDQIPPHAIEEKTLVSRFRIGACLTKAFVSVNDMRGFINIQHSTPIERWDEDIIQLVTFGATLMSHTIEQKITSEELIAAKEKAEEADKLKTAFLANISHEIRTPLNAIVGFSRLIDTEKKENQEKNKRFARIIDSNSKQLISVISDILDIAKIESGVMSVCNTSFYLTQFMNDLFIQHYENILTRNNLQIRIDLPDENLLIHTDEMKLKQILDNLLRNAMKFTPEGEICFGYRRFNEQLQFFVKDSGIGISKEHFNIIFERFKQVDDSSTRSYGGSGLGLAICQNLTRLLNGTISLESDLGTGTTFYVNIPYTQGKEEFINNQSTLSFVDLGKEFDGKRFLIVDDSHDSRLYMKLLLESAGAYCETASSGEDALEISMSSNIDAMLLDIQMPGMTGYEVLSTLQQVKPQLPIVAVTAHAMQYDRNQILRSGFNHYLSKPVMKDDLFLTLQKIVHN